MKQKFYVLLATAFSFILLTESVHAQYCGGSGSSVCTPNTSLTVQGFYPPYDSLPCVQIGVPYDQVVQMRTPATATQGGSTYTLNWIQIDTITNLPCGLCWRTSTTNNRINGNSTGCIRITGTTYDAPGQYKLHIIVSANVQVGFFPVTVSNQDGDQIGAKYWGRVENLDGTCVTVDTLATGNTAHSIGAAPAVSLAGTTSVCPGGSSSFSISNAASYYAYKWSTGATTSSINVSTAGTYSVTAYANCASATATRALTINSNPTPTITPSGPTTFCAGGSVMLDAGSGYSAYSWSNGGNTQTIIASQAGTYTVTVTQNGCTGSSNTITVTVNSSPTPVITPSSSTTFCAGDSVILDAGAGYSSYVWSSGETTQTVSALQADSYDVTVTQNGCSGTSNAVSVTVNNNPTPVINASGPTTFCAGGSVTLDAGAGYASYLWSNAATTQTINATQQGSYAVTVTQNGCSGVSVPVIVTVNSNPVVSVTPWSSTALCPGGDVWLQATTGYSSYLWSTGETANFIMATQAGQYTVTATQNGCTGVSNTITVTMTNPVATITANGPTTFCTGGSVTLDAGVGFATYLWSDASTGQTVAATQSGVYRVTTTLNGCQGVSDSVVVSVTSNTLSPTITANPSFNICPGSSATLNAGAGYDTYAWSTSSTTSSITESNAGTYEVTVTQGTCSGSASATLIVGNFPVAVNVTPAGPIEACAGDVVLLDAGAGYDIYAWSGGETTAMVNANGSGSYIVNVTSNGCVGSDTVEVNITTVVAAITPSGPVSACNGDVVTLDAGTGFSAYSWSSGDATQTTQPVSSGSYSVTVTQNNCSASDTVDVTFYAHPAVTITTSGPANPCEGDTLTLDAGASYTSYSWGGGEQTQSLEVTASGNYSVTVTENGCDGSASVAVTVTPLPQPSITPGGPVSACVGDNVTLDAGAGYDSYSWSNGDLISTTQVTTSATYSVEVSENGCLGSDSVEVTFHAIPHSTITPSGTQNLCSPQTVTFDAGAGYSAYLWSTNDTTQTITVDTTGTYNVTVTQNGCSGAATSPATVFVNPTPTATITELSSSNGQAILEAGPANATYQWLFQSTPTGPYTVEPTTTQRDTVTCGDIGEYHTVVVTQNGCSDTSAQITVVCVGIEHLAAGIKFSMMPNPANDVLHVSYELNEASNIVISLLDLTGRTVMTAINDTEDAGDHRQKLDLGHLTAGVYILNFSSHAGSFNRKFVKE